MLIDITLMKLFLTMYYNVQEKMIKVASIVVDDENCVTECIFNGRNKEKSFVDYRYV